MILAGDIGSSYTKIALLNEPRADGDIVYASYRKYLPLEKQDGAAWLALLGDIDDVLCRHRGVTVEALCFSSHGPCLLAIDQNGKPIASPHNPMHRTSVASKSYRQEYRLGSSFYLPLAQALWSLFTAEQRRRVACIVPPANYLCYLLTGELVVPIPQNYAPFFWPKAWTGTWRTIGAEPEFLHLLPKLGKFSTKIGCVRSLKTLPITMNAEHLLGLPVFCPSVDFFAAEAGLSCCPDELLRNRTGTSEGFNLPLPFQMKTQMKNKLSQKNGQLPSGYFLNHHVISDKPLLSYIQEGSGKLFERLFQLWSKKRHLNWQHELHLATYQHRENEAMLQSILGEHSAHKLARAENFAQKFVHGRHHSNKFFAALAGELGDLNKANFNDVGLYTVQVLLQYFIWHCHTIFTLYRQFTGTEFATPKQVLLYGAQADYPSWLNWKASHSHMTIYKPSISEAEFIGAAAICYHKLGYFSSIEQASKQLLKISPTYNQ